MADEICSGSKIPHISIFTQFLRNPKDEKNNNFLKHFNEGQIKEIVSACNVLPYLHVEPKLFVEEEEKNDEFGPEEEDKPKARAYNPHISKKGEKISGDQIYAKDLVTLRVELTRENVKIGDKAESVYAPYFPKLINESWWLMLTESDSSNKSSEPRIHALERLTDQGRTMIHEIKFLAPDKVGHYTMQLDILSEVYMGVDDKIDIKFEVLPAEDLPDYLPHPEDVELDNEPTLFEQVMTANVDESSDDDEDDDEDEAEERESPVDDDE